MSAVRTGGGIAAAILALLLAWLAVASFGADSVVEPTVSFGPANTAGSETSSAAVRNAITDRTRLMGDRVQSGTIAGVDVAAQQPRQTERFTTSQGVANPEALVRSWQQRGENAGILRNPDFTSGISSLPYENAALLEQPEGRDWRRTHNGMIKYGGGWLILGTAFALALFLFARGRIRTANGQSGIKVERFSAIERANHWMTATGFILLALTGLIITYGKPMLLPLIGPGAFSTLAQASAWIHMASAVPFVVGVVGMAVMWMRQNIPTRRDVEWLKLGGGFMHASDEAPPARRFNAGQKIVFWGVVLGGLVALTTGIALMYPFLWLGITGMQWAQTLHAAIGLALIALIIGHIYIGTVGMEGAVDAMWTGNVDANWAREHHRLWYESLGKEAALQHQNAPSKEGGTKFTGSPAE